MALKPCHVNEPISELININVRRSDGSTFVNAGSRPRNGIFYRRLKYS